MKTISINLYRFDELNEEAKANAVDNLREKAVCCECEFCNEDYMEVLKEFQKTFGIKVKNWFVDEYRYNYKFEFEEDIYSEWYNPQTGWQRIMTEDLTGKLLHRWLHNNVMWKITQGKYYFKNNKKRKSKVLFHEPGTNCELTGTCYDESILKPFVDAWKKGGNTDMTARDLIEECLDNFFSAWQKDLEYYTTDEAVREWIDNNIIDEQFDVHGNVA